MTATETFAWMNSRTGNDRPGDQVKQDRFRLVAYKIEKDPTLLAIPLANISRWLARGQAQNHRLHEWREIVVSAQTTAEGMKRLLALLRDDSAEAIFFKEFAPFPGVLNKEELERLSWSSAH